MELSNYVMILGALFLFSVVLIGGGIWMMRSQRKAESDRIADEKKELLGERPRPARAESGEAPDSSDRPVEHVEVLRALRDPLDGRLTVHLRGTEVEAASALSAAQREQFRRVLDELADWLDRAEEEEPVQPAPETAGPPKLQAPVPFASTLPEGPDLADMLPFRRRSLPKAEEKEPPPPPRSIAEQIDEILQEKVVQAGLDMVVRLSEEPGGGLKIVVGERQYQAIDEVMEEDVKALIKSAVRAWNEKNRLKPDR